MTLDGSELRWSHVQDGPADDTRGIDALSVLQKSKQDDAFFAIEFPSAFKLVLQCDDTKDRNEWLAELLNAQAWAHDTLAQRVVSSTTSQALVGRLEAAKRVRGVQVVDAAEFKDDSQARLANLAAELDRCDPRQVIALEPKVTPRVAAVLRRVLAAADHGQQQFDESLGPCVDCCLAILRIDAGPWIQRSLLRCSEDDDDISGDVLALLCECSLRRDIPLQGRSKVWQSLARIAGTRDGRDAVAGCLRRRGWRRARNALEEVTTEDLQALVNLVATVATRPQGPRFVQDRVLLNKELRVHGVARVLDAIDLPDVEPQQRRPSRYARLMSLGTKRPPVEDATTKAMVDAWRRSCAEDDACEAERHAKTRRNLAAFRKGGAPPSLAAVAALVVSQPLDKALVDALLSSSRETLLLRDDLTPAASSLAKSLQQQQQQHHDPRRGDDDETEEPQASPSAAVTDPRYAKYAKLQKMGLPEAALRIKMTAEGLDPDAFFGTTNGTPEPQKDLPPPALLGTETSIPLRPLWWDPLEVPQYDKSWWRTTDLDSAREAVLQGMDLLEDGFPAKNGRPRRKTITQVIEVFDGKRFQAAGIALRKLEERGLGDPKKAAQAIGDALAHDDDGPLDEDGAVLLEIVGLPTTAADDTTELEALKKGQYLRKEEAYVLELRELVPRLRSRLEVIKAKLGFREKVDDADDRATRRLEACRAVETSAALRRIFRVALFVGNAMNATKPNLLAAGIPLSALEMLAKAKGNDDMTGLAVVVAVDRRSALDLDDDLKLDDVGDDVKDIVADLDTDLRSAQTEQAASAFVDDLAATVDRLRNRLADVDKATTHLLMTFGEDPSKTDPASWFARLRTIVATITRIAEDMNARDDDALRRAQLRRLVVPPPPLPPRSGDLLSQIAQVDPILNRFHGDLSTNHLDDLLAVDDDDDDV